MMQPENKTVWWCAKRFLLGGWGFRLLQPCAQPETEHGVSPPYPLFALLWRKHFRLPLGIAKAA